MTTGPLPLGLTAAALTAASAEPDPESLAAATRLRDRFGPGQAAAAVTQVMLRRRAVAKFGVAAEDMFFTTVGLEQATRGEVAAQHAARLVSAGVRRVVDLGCGIGADSLAFVAAGLQVVAVDRDRETAEVAAANLGEGAEVIVGEVEDLWPELRDDGTGFFCDPARRNAAGRLWRVEDFSPSWSFVTALLSSGRPGGVKLGPALPHALIPDGVEAEWTSHHGSVVEVALWVGTNARAGARVAHLLPAGDRIEGRLDAAGLSVGDPRGYLYEPDGAVIRAGALTQLGLELHATQIAPRIAYLTSDRRVDTPYAARFRIVEVLPYRDKVLRAWLREHDIGELEIKKRGIDIDPATLRKRLKLSGAGRATIVVTPTVAGTRILVVRREPLWHPVAGTRKG